jgi:crotonobetainyl-CoA:carnitine CoA-transferase CaiB-like acyl-CoA transferase
VTEVAARARLLGVPASPLRQFVPARAPRVRSTAMWPSAGRRTLEGLRIIDLSSMWAGPMATMLLSRAGSHVVKVESTTRPDGARAVESFYQTLHHEDQQVEVLDFTDAEGRRRLRQLLDEADIVVDSSRPRALEQLGAGPADVSVRPGRVWVSITGYGRAWPGRDWAAFGDDAAVAGGLVAWESEAHPVFLGDAIADPVTGMVAARATFQALADGGGALLDISMQACAASLVPMDAPTL